MKLKKKSKIKKFKFTKKKCNKFLSKKISKNMKEYKKGRWKNRKQALAVSYSQTKKKYPKCDFVFSLNVFDHYKNWKQVLKAYKNLTNKYICMNVNFKF